MRKAFAAACRSALLLALAAGVPAAAAAQVGLASVSGTSTDGSGGVLPGVTDALVIVHVMRDRIVLFKDLPWSSG